MDGVVSPANRSEIATREGWLSEAKLAPRDCTKKRKCQLTHPLSSTRWPWRAVYVRSEKWPYVNYDKEWYHLSPWETPLIPYI